MPAVLKRKPRFKTFAEALAALGNIPPERVRLDPQPGTATKRDLLKFHDGGEGLFELVDGTLVEKPMGRPESILAAELVRLLGNYVTEHSLGFCTTTDDLIEVLPNLVLGPDASFTTWLRTPDGTVDFHNQISKIVPDLTVEVLSPSNTRAEMTRKLGEYFRGGVRLVWIIDPRKRTAEIYVSPTEKTTIAESGVLDGGDVLPGFRLPLAKLFLQAPKKPPRKK